MTNKIDTREPETRNLPPAIMANGGQAMVFAWNVPIRYLCCRCTNILKDPIQARCSHLYCLSCFFNYVRLGDRIVCLKCLAEGEYTVLKLNEVYPDNAVKREIYKDAGWKWNGPLKLPQDHANGGPNPAQPRSAHDVHHQYHPATHAFQGPGNIVAT